jgi:SHS2 domain-containing protein
MRNYLILPHTSEIRIKAVGDTLQELFSASLEGMNSVIKKNFSAVSSLMNYRDVIEVTSKDSTMLLIDFLSEVLTLSHEFKAVFHTVSFRKLDECSLSADIEGDRIDGFDEDIKAVTYTEANIVKNERNNFETIIVFDI